MHIDVQKDDSSDLTLVLRNLAANNRRKTAEKTVTKLIEILLRDGYRFDNILQAMCDYAEAQIDYIPREKPSWEIIASLLQMAVTQTVVKSEDEDELTIALNRMTDSVRRMDLQETRINLQQTMAEMIASLQEDRYRVTDILQAFTDYATEKPTWRWTASLLQLAAQQAQVEGRELP